MDERHDGKREMDGISGGARGVTRRRKEISRYCTTRSGLKGSAQRASARTASEPSLARQRRDTGTRGACSCDIVDLPRTGRRCGRHQLAPIELALAPIELSRSVPRRANATQRGQFDVRGRLRACRRKHGTRVRVRSMRHRVRDVHDEHVVVESNPANFRIFSPDEFASNTCPKR